MTKIVVSRRDGIAREPETGIQHRIYRGRTLADADHPLVLANPADWTPMEVQLALPTTGEASVAGESLTSEQIAQYENDVAELTETLEQRDAELQRLADGLWQLGVKLPDEDDREPGWLVDLALDLATSAKNPPAAAPPAAAPEIAPVPPPRGATRRVKTPPA